MPSSGRRRRVAHRWPSIGPAVKPAPGRARNRRRGWNRPSPLGALPARRGLEATGCALPQRLHALEQLWRWIGIGGQAQLQLRGLDAGARGGADLAVDLAAEITA